jgi:glucan 1,3-beta-glucosidase
MAPRESERPKHRERSHHHAKRKPHRSKYESASSQFGSQLLSSDARSKLDRLNQQSTRSTEVTPKKTRRNRHREVINEKIVVEKRRDHKRRKRRVVSGALLEEGDGSRLKGLRGGERYEKEYDEEDDGRKRKRQGRLFRRGKVQHC